MKKVSVNMSDDCYAVLKAYAAYFDMTVSDVLYGFTRQEIHHHASSCSFTDGLLQSKNIPQDKRASKPCWGHSCLVCNHDAMCRAGLTDETFSPKESIRHLLKPDSPVHQLYKS